MDKIYRHEQPVVCLQHVIKIVNFFCAHRAQGSCGWVANTTEIFVSFSCMPNCKNLAELAKFCVINNGVILYNLSLNHG